MTEREKLQRAKMYIDKLTAGIDPLTDLPIPPSDTVCQPRISRCLAYVSEVLGQVIDEFNRPLASPTAEKEAFYIPPERRELFEFSETALSLSDIVNRLNVLRSNESYKKLTHATISAWLEEIGILRRETYGEKSYLRPSEPGRAWGVSIEHRTGINGEYDVVVYNLEMQHLLLNNLDGLFAYIRDFTAMQGKAWTDDQINLLKDLSRQGVPFQEIAKILKRNPDSVRSRMKKLGLIPQ